MTEDAAAFLAKNSTRIDVWALPGKHQGEYNQVVVAAIKGAQPNPTALYQAILAGKAEPLPLTVQPEPLYKLPPPPQITRYVFAPDIIDEELQSIKPVVDVRRGDTPPNGLSEAVERHLAEYFASFGKALPPPNLYDRILADVERPLFIAALAATHGNQIKAADLLGLNRNTLRKRIRELDIEVLRGFTSAPSGGH